MIIVKYDTRATSHSKVKNKMEIYIYQRPWNCTLKMLNFEIK